MELTKDELRTLREIRQQRGNGEALSQPELDKLAAQWQHIVPGATIEGSEMFPLVDAQGSPTGIVGPRWLFHLLGLQHPAVDVGLVTPSGLVVIQRRSWTKADSPGVWDIAVSGHVPAFNGAPMPWSEAALKELGEELGIDATSDKDLLAPPGLVEIGGPFCCFDARPTDNPPHHNAEVRQLFGAVLTAKGAAALKPDHEELSGILLCSPREAWHLAMTEPVSSGLYYSLPRFLDWAAKLPPHNL